MAYLVSFLLPRAYNIIYLQFVICIWSPWMYCCSNLQRLSLLVREGAKSKHMVNICSSVHWCITDLWAAAWHPSVVIPKFTIFNTVLETAPWKGGVNEHDALLQEQSQTASLIPLCVVELWEVTFNVPHSPLTHAPDYVCLYSHLHQMIL